MNPTWQTKVEGGYGIDRFEIDWDRGRMRCPQGQLSSAWSRQVATHPWTGVASGACVSSRLEQVDLGDPSTPPGKLSSVQARTSSIPARAGFG